MTDDVDHPPHYGGAHNPYEAIKVIRALGLGFSHLEATGGSQQVESSG